MENIKETFLRNVKDHNIQVALDNGVYRHLIFKKESCFQYSFNIITFPGILIISGDMGTFAFRRINDMFDFFPCEVHNDCKELCINIGYWSEKLIAVDRTDGYYQFCEEAFTQAVKEDVGQFLCENDGKFSEEQIKDFMEEVDEMINSCDHEDQVYGHLNSWHFESINMGAEDIFYTDEGYQCKDYKYCYRWCLYAIVWAIQKYNEHKGVKSQ